jgi:hypothetical protein
MCRLIVLSPLVLLPDPLHVLPDVSFKLRVAQEKGRVIRGHKLGTLIGVEASPEEGDPLLGTQEGLGRKGPEAADDPWFDSLQLFEEKGEAGLDLVRFGIAIVRGAAFHDVGDIYLLSGQLYGLNDTGEEFPRPADKGFALQIFFSARALSDKDECGMGVAFAEDYVVSFLMESAPGALPQLLSDAIEGQMFSPGALCEEGVDAQLLVIVQVPLQLGDDEIYCSTRVFFHRLRNLSCEGMILLRLLLMFLPLG